MALVLKKLVLLVIAAAVLYLGAGWAYRMAVAMQAEQTLRRELGAGAMVRGVEFRTRYLERAVRHGTGRVEVNLEPAEFSRGVKPAEAVVYVVAEGRFWPRRVSVSRDRLRPAKRVTR